MATRVLFDLGTGNSIARRNAIEPVTVAPASVSFTDFIKKQVGTSGFTGEAIDMSQYSEVMVQAFVTAVGGTLAGGSVKLQGSIMGGTQASAWFDVSAAVNVTAIESSEQHILNLSSTYAPMQFRYLRIWADTSASTFDAYFVCYAKGRV